MSVLGYWFICVEWLWVQGDKDTGVIKWKCLRGKKSFREEAATGLQGLQETASLGSAVHLGFPVWHISSKVSTDRASAMERKELPL